MVENFIFYKSWFDKLKDFKDETAREHFAWKIIEYGITGELDTDDCDDFAKAWLTQISEQIKYSKDKYEAKVSTKGRKKSYDEEELRQLVMKGLSAEEIAKQLGLTRDAIYKTFIWKNRKNY